MTQLALVLLVLQALPVPTPTPGPLKEISHVYSTPFCSAFENNIKHSVQGMLANDVLVKQTDPVFVKTARDMITAPPESRFNSTEPARTPDDTPALHLDMERLRDLSTSIAHNLKVIDQLLDDVQRFPKTASGEEMKQLLALRDKLRQIAKAQNDELNVLAGTADEYMMDTFFNRDVSLNGALSASGKPAADAGVLQGGPIASKARGGDPELLRNGMFMDTQIGAVYRDLVAKENAEHDLEQTFTPQFTDAATHCRP